MKRFIFVMVFILFSANEMRAFSISYYAPSQFSTNMAVTNANLGISGYLFEDFEDNTLRAGLKITAIANVANGWVSNPTTTVYQGTFSAGPGIYAGQTAESWSSNGQILYPQVVANIHRFEFAKGISSFGIGIAEIDDIGGPHAIVVNGVDTGLRVENLAGFVRGARNLYVRVDAGVGEQIQSFELVTLSSVESLFFSHLAFKEDPSVGITIPEANCWALMLGGLALWMILGKYRLE